jgi:hypothetical protein
MKAFPIIDFENSEDGYIYFDQGMDLRDYFAAKAMQALLFDIKAIQVDMNKTADLAYKFADEMMRAREK